MAGIGIGGEFAQFLRVKDSLQKIEYCLKDPENCTLPSESRELDILWVLITSTAEWYNTNQEESDRMDDVFRLVGRSYHNARASCIDFRKFSENPTSYTNFTFFLYKSPSKTAVSLLARVDHIIMIPKDHR
jgi:hypothetical protein